MRRWLRRLVAVLTGSLLVPGIASVQGMDDSAPGTVARVSQKSGQGTKARSKKSQSRKRAASDATAPEPSPTTPAPPSDGGLKFSRDIAPILVANCGGCHNARRLQGKLDLGTFEAIMKGTPDEKVIVPGKPEESHLVLRIKGEEEPRMPRGANRTLSSEAIDRITNWVKAGALLDAGIDPKAPLEKYAASPEDLRKAELARMAPAERDKKIEEVGLERLKKANPRLVPQLTPSAHFVWFGTLPKTRVSSAARALEGAYPQLKSVVGDALLDLGEKISVYVFDDRATFVEFARVIETRELEPEIVSLVNLGVAEPYIAVIDPLEGHDELPSPARKGVRARGRSGTGGEGEERSLAGLVVEQFASGAVARAGKAPRWLTLGLGAQFASRIDPRSTQVTQLRQTAAQLLQQGWAAKASEALGDAGKTEDIQAVGFVVLESLIRSARPAYPAFIRGMFAGQEKLDDVIQSTLGINRDQFLRATGQFVAVSAGR